MNMMAINDATGNITGGDSDVMGDVMSGVMEMTMTFNNQLPFQLLFKDVNIKDQLNLVAACVVMFVVAIFHEYIKFLRLKIMSSSFQPCCGCSNQKSSSVVKVFCSKTNSKSNKEQLQESYVVEETSHPRNEKNQSQTIVIHFIETFLYFFQIFFSYVTMLSIMTYNVMIFLAILFGLTVGYFIFNWPSKKIKKRAIKMQMKLLNGECCQ